MIDRRDRRDIERDKERIKSQFFIDPSGQIYRYKGDVSNIASVHGEIACTLFPGIEDPETYMMNLGWVLCGSSVYNCPIIHRKPTQSQLDTLFDLKLLDRLCFLYKDSYPNYVKYQILLD